jgi:hypothetical protein
MRKKGEKLNRGVIMKHGLLHRVLAVSLALIVLLNSLAIVTGKAAGTSQTLPHPIHSDMDTTQRPVN